MPTKPYLSIVFCGRNDDYGGDFNSRLQTSINWLSQLVERYQVETELLLVNYNPIKEKTGLEDCIQWPKSRQYLMIKLITVPNEIHQELIDIKVRKTVPLFEFIAKNIGIKRANGEFILCTNADVLFSEKVMETLSKKALKKNTLYRCDRFDFTLNEDEKSNLSENQIRANVFNFFMQGGTFSLKFPKDLDQRIQLCQKYNAIRKRYYPLAAPMTFLKFIPIIPWVKKDELFFFVYHCNASGDFALMDQNSWYLTEGYHEDTWISTHTDSLHVAKCMALGISIEVLSAPVYHQHHERRFAFNEKNKDMDKMHIRLVKEWNQMNLLKKCPPQINWGFRNYKFQEIIL